ncbi:MAG TPA: hypothetical protein PKK00_11525 [Bacteroidales bacterium]|nr:hypothetical protein [Bacteroidales bacterium]HPS18181.1 hypothetical protein [Bacteroidales bacterium]
MKGIYCLEGKWNDDLREKTSVRPILELLHSNRGIEFIYHSCATAEEIEFLLTKWTLRKYKRFPILYLAFHGEKNQILLNDKSSYSLDELANIVSGKCSNSIIIFGSCSTLAIRKNYLKKFLDKTGALAICGYQRDVDWLHSTAFEMLILSEMQENEFSKRGISAIENKINSICRKFQDELEFRMVTSKEI